MVDFACKALDHAVDLPFNDRLIYKVHVSRTDKAIVTLPAETIEDRTNLILKCSLIRVHGS